MSIEKQLKPLLVRGYENIIAFNLLKCNTVVICPILWRSLDSMIPNLSTIGNVSKSTGILILNGENDTQTPVQQAFLLQQKLTDVGHPDHTLITYTNLGHVFYPSSQWWTGIGPIQQYVLADLVCMACSTFWSFTFLRSYFSRLHSVVLSLTKLADNLPSANKSQDLNLADLLNSKQPTTAYNKDSIEKSIR